MFTKFHSNKLQSVSIGKIQDANMRASAEQGAV